MSYFHSKDKLFIRILYKIRPYSSNPTVITSFANIVRKGTTASLTLCAFIFICHIWTVSGISTKQRIGRTAVDGLAIFEGLFVGPLAYGPKEFENYSVDNLIKK